MRDLEEERKQLEKKLEAQRKLVEEKEEAAAYHKALAEQTSPEHRQAKANHRRSRERLHYGVQSVVLLSRALILKRIKSGQPRGAADAARSGHLDLIELAHERALLEGNAPFDATRCWRAAIEGGKTEAMAWVYKRHAAACERLEGDHGALRVRQYEGPCARAARHGQLGALAWLRDDRVRTRWAWDEQTIAEAARRGDLPMIKWCRTRPRPCPWGPDAAKFAARHGHVHVLEYLRFGDAEDGPPRDGPCEWTSDACAQAALGGHLGTLQWLREEMHDDPDDALMDGPCPWDARCAANAAEHGHLDVLAWARSQSPPCPWDSQTTGWAAMGGHVETLRFALENGCPCDEDFLLALPDLADAVRDCVLAFILARDGPTEEEIARRKRAAAEARAKAEEDARLAALRPPPEVQAAQAWANLLEHDRDEIRIMWDGNTGLPVFTYLTDDGLPHALKCDWSPDREGAGGGGGAKEGKKLSASSARQLEILRRHARLCPTCSRVFGGKDDGEGDLPFEIDACCTRLMPATRISSSSKEEGKDDD